MYVCACMYACMYVCIYVYLFILMHTSPSSINAHNESVSLHLRLPLLQQQAEPKAVKQRLREIVEAEVVLLGS